MNAVVLITVSLLLVAGITVGILARRGRGPSRRGAGPPPPEAEVCVLCLEPLPEGIRLIAMSGVYTRELLGEGRKPDERSGTTDPYGERRYAAHVECVEAAAAEKQACMYCEAAILPDDRVLGVPEAAARQLLGEEPPERSAGTNPHGQPCYIAHERCARSAGVDLSRATHIP
jgi:hypothetical protein